MTFPPFIAVARTAGTFQNLTLALLPHGGQGAARRNAWSAVSEDAVRARARREAERAMDHAVRTPERTARAR